MSDQPEPPGTPARRPLSRSGARPRDALGRPLPHGARGVPPLPEATPLVAADALAEAQRLLDAGYPFQAHEVLEAVWKNADADESSLWRGLAQLAVGITHLARGNIKGGVALLRRGSDNLAPYAGQHPHDVDVSGLRAWAARRTAEIGRTHPDLPCIADPAASVAPTDPRPAPNITNGTDSTGVTNGTDRTEATDSTGATGQPGAGTIEVPRLVR